MGLFSREEEVPDTQFERGGHLVNISGKLLWWAITLAVSAILLSEIPEVYLENYEKDMDTQGIWNKMILLSFALGTAGVVGYNIGMSMRNSVRKGKVKSKKQ